MRDLTPVPALGSTYPSSAPPYPSPGCGSPSLYICNLLKTPAGGSKTMWVHHSLHLSLRRSLLRPQNSST